MIHLLWIYLKPGLEQLFMKFSAFINLPVFIFLMAVSSLPATAEETPEVTVDGLYHIKDTNLAIVYIQPDADLGQYRRVYLLDAYVAFKKNWQPDQNRSMVHRINADDMAKIKAELSSLFQDVFTKTLQESGYELATERAEDVLMIKPAIINLDLIAPDTTSAGSTHSYSESAGKMTLYLELYDSVTNDLIAKALDRKKDRQTGYFKWQDRISNRAAANRILQVWANVLKEGLDEAMGNAGSQSTQIPALRAKN